MEQPRPYEFSVAGYDLTLELGMCACVLFRTKSEVDYLSVEMPQDGEEHYLRVYNNAELVHWLSGYRPLVQDGRIIRPIIRRNKKTFRQVHGWNPATIEREAPSDVEEGQFIEVVAPDIAAEWDQWEATG